MDYFRHMESIEIRDATLTDLPTLLHFEQELIKAERPFDPTIKDGKISYYDIASYIKRSDVKVVVAECNGKVVSSGYALKREARHYLNHQYYGYLGFMYTDEEYRGRAINQKIVEVLKDWCLENKLEEIRLSVYDENEPAIKAYVKAGFKRHMIEMRIS